MSSEENKNIERRFFAAMNNHDAAALDGLLAADFVDRSGLAGGATDRESYKKAFVEAWAAVPDFQTTLEDLVAEGDRVVHRFTARGTPTGPWMGIPPTGKQFAVPGIAIHRMAGGKIVENWANIDMLGMLQQLGVILPPGATR